MKRQGFVQALAALALTTSVHATTHPYIVTGTDIVSGSEKSLPSFQVLDIKDDVALAMVHDSDKAHLSHIVHEDHHRCGGYFAFETKEEAQKFIAESKANKSENTIFADYSINQEDLVNKHIVRADEMSIRSTILKLSSFKNRYYKSQTGIDSQAWLKSHWTDLTKHRSDITVEYFNHSSYPQPSVIATIQGESDDVIVIGGHADSIAGWWGRENARAPGADDNASGTATVTETLRVLAESGYTPKKTIKFMAYAAEEVGLLGSKDIAKDFKRRGINVEGVLQLDMTNHFGSREDITIITDYTNKAQNDFLGSLIDKYLTNLTWGRDKCGYACSDHASWTSQGYPASTPFETKKSDMNRHIHTSRDTLDNMGGNADHALKFSKLALAYVIELDR
jgi:leucyl aminopeptidase